MTLGANKRLAIIIVVAIFIMVCLFIAPLIYGRVAKADTINCESYVSYQSAPGDLSYDTMISVNIYHNGNGSFSVEGTIRDADSSWHYNRDVKFVYQNMEEGAISIKVDHITKYGRDNGPDELFKRAFLSSDEKASRVITISKIKNGYLMGIPRAPLFICLPK